MLLGSSSRYGAALGAAVSAAMLAGGARAQSGWEYSLSVYGWFTGLSSEVDTRFGQVDADLTFGDIWEDLDMAAFAAFEARSGRWALVTDLNYSRISAEEGAPADLPFEDVEVETELTILSALAAYSVIDRTDLRVDLAGGLRYYDVALDVDLNAAASADDRATSFGDDWIDAVVGARVHAPISEFWYITGFADLGGFGIGDSSDLSGQIYAGVGYRFNETWQIEGGYRYLSIDREIDGNDTELELFGPLVGVTARF